MQRQFTKTTGGNALIVTELGDDGVHNSVIPAKSIIHATLDSDEDGALCARIVLGVVDDVELDDLSKDEANALMQVVTEIL